ncbi:TOBE domain-containing protein [Leeuwenhoekiella marinoflava]|uniref:TOBE domain-containing protein n=1 Tax=Leeuwenhoekiella marinoflava TaxID=988 RepID=UPI003001390E
MNRLNGNISRIEVSGNLTLAHVEVTPQLVLKAIVIDTPKTAAYLKVGQEVALVFKETEVIIGTNSQIKISLQNQIPASINKIERGQLLSKLNLRTITGELNAIVSTNAVKTLCLKTGDAVVAIVKLNEVMLQAL